MEPAKFHITQEKNSELYHSDKNNILDLQAFAQLFSIVLADAQILLVCRTLKIISKAQILETDLPLVFPTILVMEKKATHRKSAQTGGTCREAVRATIFWK